MMLFSYTSSIPNWRPPQAENLKLMLQAMNADPDLKTAKGISGGPGAKIKNCSQAKLNNFLNSALQLFLDLITSIGKATGRKVSLIQGGNLNDLIQAVDSGAKSKS
jgi:hypothetical protein